MKEQFSGAPQWQKRELPSVTVLLAILVLVIYVPGVSLWLVDAC